MTSIYKNTRAFSSARKRIFPCGSNGCFWKDTPHHLSDVLLVKEYIMKQSKHKMDSIAADFPADSAKSDSESCQ